MGGEHGSEGCMVNIGACITSSDKLIPMGLDSVKEDYMCCVESRHLDFERKGIVVSFATHINELSSTSNHPISYLPRYLQKQITVTV